MKVDKETTVFQAQFVELTKRHPSLNVIEEDLKQAFFQLVSSIKNGNKILCAGNGGSNADAEHIVGELLKGFLKKRPITEEIRKALQLHFPEEAAQFEQNLQMPIPAISLMGHPSFQTAFSNDMQPVYSISQHLLGLGKKGDVFIAISTSGNSPNMVLAAKLAKSLGIFSIGLTGESGGELDKFCDICIKAPSRQVHYVQELHLPIYHSLCLMLEEIFFKI